MADVSFYDSMLGTYATFSGCDAVATFANKVIGELQGININISREKAPAYVLGRPDPISFSRGKRGIAGTMVLLTFDRNMLQEAIITAMSDGGPIVGFTSQYGPTTVGTDYQGKQDYTFAGGAFNAYGTTIENYNAVVQEALTSNSPMGPFRQLTYNYDDQLPPFDITVTFANEYGSAAHMIIFKAEILNEGMGISVDDVVLERACTFVCRGLQTIRPGFKSSGSALQRPTGAPIPSGYEGINAMPAGAGLFINK